MHDDLARDPQAAVLRWWASLQSKDLSALHNQVRTDYVSSGGPAGRTIGREAFLDEARQFLSPETRIDDWTVEDMEIRLHDEVAVCSYRWRERGAHAGSDFAFEGEATDVLVNESSGWRHLAHHVSLTAPASPTLPSA